MTTPAHKTGRTAHTSGPWSLDGGVIRGWTGEGADRHERPICEVYREASSSPETIANAHLLLAAPDLVKALEDLVNAKALQGVRQQVAGWNGEGRDTGPFERHPPRLGATLPKTDCGAIYELDDAMQAARAALSASRSTGDQS